MHIGMKLWLVTRPEGNWANFDEYESFVCAAETEDEARNTHPDGRGWRWDGNQWVWEETDKDNNVRFRPVWPPLWPIDPAAAVIRCIAGTTGEPKGVVLASFNAA